MSDNEKQPVPVEPDTKYWRNVANDGRGSLMTDCLHKACDAIDALQAALKRVQDSCDRLTGMKFSDRVHPALLSRAEAAESLNRRMVELLKSDDYASGFQSLGQYRNALIKEVK